MSREFDYESWQAKMIALELANEVGRAIIKSLAEEPKTASQLSKALEIPLPTILFHISRLDEAGVVESRRALGKRLREVKVYSVPSTEITFKIGGGKNEQEEQ